MRISDWSSDVCSSDLAKVLAVDLNDSAATETRSLIDGEGGVCETFRADASSAADNAAMEIGSASCRDRVCQYVSISVVAVSFKKKNKHHYKQQSTIYHITVHTSQHQNLI